MHSDERQLAYINTGRNPFLCVTLKPGSAILTSIVSDFATSIMLALSQFHFSFMSVSSQLYNVDFILREEASLFE
jgi:hypothetical protein